MGALGVYRSRFPSPDVVVGEETWLIDKDGSRQQFQSAIPIGLHRQSEYSHRDQADSAGSGFALGEGIPRFRTSASLLLGVVRSDFRLRGGTENCRSFKDRNGANCEGIRITPG
jgi:hypothetical protein